MNEKFEPKIGDYVETIKGEIGYIIKFYYSCCFIKFKDMVKVYECTSLDEKHFKQIGTHKFNQNKNIKKLENIPTYEEKLCKVLNIKSDDYLTDILMTAAEPTYEKRNILTGFTAPGISDIVSKINEIVDFINKLSN